MLAEATIRPMVAADVEAVAAVITAALATIVTDEDGHAAGRRRRRIAHLQAVAGAHATVAQAPDGEIAGVAIALVRDRLWGLSLLHVDPLRQARGLGHRLLREALRSAATCDRRLIVSSPHPRALRLYQRSGHRAWPGLQAAGQINRARLPAGLRTRVGDLAADRELCDAISRSVRGAPHGPDLDALVADGCQLLICGDAGFAFSDRGRPVVLAAHDERSARDLLLSCLAQGPAGASVHIDPIPAGNDWALSAALDAGLALAPGLVLFGAGADVAPCPYLPTGAFL